MFPKESLDVDRPDQPGLACRRQDLISFLARKKIKSSPVQVAARPARQETGLDFFFRPAAEETGLDFFTGRK